MKSKIIKSSNESAALIERQSILGYVVLALHMLNIAASLVGIMYWGQNNTGVEEENLTNLLYNVCVCVAWCSQDSECSGGEGTSYPGADSRGPEKVRVP